MDLTDTDLPDDIDALKALVRAHAASAHANAQRVVELQDQLSSRVIEIEHLTDDCEAAPHAVRSQV
ncbi:hypothetical protein OKW34_003269 [Paraburkholderia youngii]